MLGPKVRFEGVKGVGTVELDFQEEQRVYTLIGTNGVGKTKALEALFQAFFFTNASVGKASLANSLHLNEWVFRSGADANSWLNEPQWAKPNSNLPKWTKPKLDIGWSQEARLKLGLVGDEDSYHHLPIIYLASQSRGFIEHKNISMPIGSFQERKRTYLEEVTDGMRDEFSSLNMTGNIGQWFVMLAQSSNKFQKREDNREIEINTLLKLLNKIDTQIDPKHLEIDGEGRVSLMINNRPCELSHLSTGFASIVKIIQAVVSGYGCFTNENDLEHVKGIVLIDEIESHLHLTWQAKIIPLLKALFPNTIFYITTHSPIVLSQLHEGEAYRLERHDDGVVRTALLKRPNKAAIVDVLKDAFDIDLNQIKRDNMSAESQKAVKQQLLDLLNDEESAQ